MEILVAEGIPVLIIGSSAKAGTPATAENTLTAGTKGSPTVAMASSKDDATGT
jgi:hypothetical protein